MGLLRETISEYIEDRCMQMAAALAFYTMLSLVPLLLVVVTTASAVMGGGARERFIGQAEQVVGKQGADELEELLTLGQKDQPFALKAESSITESITRIATIALLIFSATSVMAQLQTSLNQVWEVEPDSSQGGVKNFIVKRALSLAMILGIAFLLLVSMLLTTALGIAGKWITDWLGIGIGVQYLISEGTTFVLITVLFAAMFKVLPDAQVPWKVTWIGAVLTAVLFTAGKFLIGLYLSHKDMGSSYGQAGSLVLLLVWIYYSAMIFLFGAELTQVWARRWGWTIAPAKGAVRVVLRKDREQS